MGASRIELKANSFEDLKAEIEEHLNYLFRRHSSKGVMDKPEIPFSFYATVEPGQIQSQTWVFPKGGIISNFVSHTPKGAKNIQMNLQELRDGSSSSHVFNLQEGIKIVDHRTVLKQPTNISIGVVNEGTSPATVAIGFTYKEVSNATLEE